MLKLLIGMLVYPGGVSAFLLGILLEGLRRKLTARMQLRIGPPIFQPLLDLTKLLNKENLKPHSSSSFLYVFIPFLGTIALLICFLFLALPYHSHPFYSFDMIFIFYLTEIPLISQIIFGFFTRSPYGMIGGSRALQMLFCYNVGFISAIVILAFLVTPYSSFCLKEIATQTWNTEAIVIKLLSLPIFMISVLAKLKFNPFSIPNAEGEILEGPLTEASGFSLFLFKLNYLLELSLFSYLFCLLYLPVLLVTLLVTPLLGLIILSFGSIVFIFILSVVENITARIRLSQFFSMFLKGVIPYSLVVLVVSWLIKTFLKVS